jgi:glutamine synthetase
VSIVRGEELVAFLHSDISGLNRGRSVPAAELDERFAAGVGWVPADRALTPFVPIAEPNPFGPLGDLRLLPGRDTRVRVDLWEDASPLHFYLCDAVNTEGSPWDACPRTLLKGALTQLEEVGFRLVASFEQEFILEDLSVEPGPGFSLEAQRLVEPFGPEVFLPEYGESQYEVPCAPAGGATGADRAAAMREVVREVDCRLRYRVSFVPKADPEGVGNGVNIHLSLVDLEDHPVFYYPERPGRLSIVGFRFAAGILEHLPALCAFTAPSLVSYLRFVPHI